MSRKRRYLIAALVALVVTFPVLHRCHSPEGWPGTLAVVSFPLTGHTLPIRRLAFSGSGTTLTSAAWNPGGAPTVEVAVWDLATGQRLGHHQKRPGGLLDLAIAPDGQRLVLALEAGGLVWWDLSPWRERLVPTPLRIRAVAFSSDGMLLATANARDEVALSDEASSATWSAESPGVLLLAMARGESVLAVGSRLGPVQLWNLRTGQIQARLPGHSSFVQSLAFSPDGRTLASAGNNGDVKLWDVTTGSERATLRSSGHEAHLGFPGNGEALAVTDGCNVQIWDVRTRSLRATLEGHTGPIRCLAVSPDGTRLATGGADRTVRFWDLARTLEGWLQ